MTFYCPNCCNENPTEAAECRICGLNFLPECPRCENVLEIGEECDCHLEHARDLHEREKNEDDGREYGHPGDRLRGWE